MGMQLFGKSYSGGEIREDLKSKTLMSHHTCRQCGEIPREDNATLELYWLHAQLHDCVPSPVRGVDRVHVGLHVGRLQGLRPLLPCHGCHRELSCKFTAVVPAGKHTNIWLIKVLNLFLALLLSSFGASNLSGANNDEDGTNKLTEAFNRIGRFKRFIKNLIMRVVTFLKDRILDCFRRSLTFERGKTEQYKLFRLNI